MFGFRKLQVGNKHFTFKNSLTSYPQLLSLPIYSQSLKQNNNQQFSSISYTFQDLDSSREFSNIIKSQKSQWMQNRLDQMKINTPFTFKSHSPSFEDIRKNKLQFVDRSLLIYELLKQDRSPYLITHLRRTGKTTNLLMLQDFFSLQLDPNGNQDKEAQAKKEALFFESNDETFSPLKISQVNDLENPMKLHFGIYPTLLLNLQDLKGKTEEQLIASLKTVVQQQFVKHCYLAKGELNQYEQNIFDKYINKEFNDSDINQALPFLISLLAKKHKQKVIVLVDEYDSIFNSYIQKEKPNYNLIESIQECITNFLKPLGKSTDSHVKMLVMTGIYDSLVKTDSGFNNLTKLDVTNNSIEGYYGLTEQEVLQKLKLTFKIESKQQEEQLMDQMKLLYNGYYGEKENYYNIWSFYSYLYYASSLYKSRKTIPPPKGFWIPSGKMFILIYLLQNCTHLSIKKKMVELSKGNSVRLEWSNSTNLYEPYLDKGQKQQEEYYSNFLLSAGYITKDRSNPNLFKVPNREVLEQFQSNVENHLDSHLKQENLLPLLNAILKKQPNEVENQLKQIFLQNVSNHDLPVRIEDTQSEMNYHNLILGLLLYRVSHYEFYSNQEAGSGRADIILLPLQDKNLPGFIIEFKVLNSNSLQKDQLTKKAEEGMNQIKEKDYISFVKKNNVQNCGYYSIAFYKKEVKVLYEEIIQETQDTFTLNKQEIDELL